LQERNKVSRDPERFTHCRTAYGALHQLCKDNKAAFIKRTQIYSPLKSLISNPLQHFLHSISTKISGSGIQ